MQAVEDKIREVIPDKDRQLIVDNIGLPARAYNLAFTDGSTIGANDGVIMVSLNEGHAPTADYVRKLREVLPAAFPDVMFYFQAADIVTQILNFGLPPQIDVRTIGARPGQQPQSGEGAATRIAAIPGIADAHLQQEVDSPAFQASIDRTRAAAAWAERQHDREQHQCELELIAAGHAEFLDRSRDRHPVLHRGADAAIFGGFVERSAQHAGVDALSPSGNPIPGMLSNVVTLKRDSLPTNSNQTNIQPVLRHLCQRPGP